MKKLIVVGVVGLLILSLMATSYYFFSQYKKTQTLLNNPTMAAKEEVKEITAKLAKFIELPPKEEPIVVTVLDKNKLKDQEFFKKAENGDKVIVYTTSKKAILYRPNTNKIIEVAPVNLGDVNQPIRIALYNGTTTEMTTELEKELTQKVTNIAVVSKESAKKTDYEKTLVIDLSGKRPELAKQLADLLNGQVSTLPKDEVVPKDADLLTIIGADYKRGELNIQTVPTASMSPPVIK